MAIETLSPEVKAVICLVCFADDKFTLPTFEETFLNTCFFFCSILTIPSVSQSYIVNHSCFGCFILCMYRRGDNVEATVQK